MSRLTGVLLFPAGVLAGALAWSTAFPPVQPAAAPPVVRAKARADPTPRPWQPLQQSMAH